jgi:hypothetical protein
MNVRDLDLMTYSEKTLHWMGHKNPWSPDGVPLRFKQPLRSFTAMNEEGNVWHMPLLVGRPCYGIITALLRYKDAMKPVKGKGMLPASRCATSCRLRESCERLVKERIKASPVIKAAHEDWLKAEGPSKFSAPQFETSAAGRSWKRLGLAAADAGFTSCNDATITEYYVNLDRESLVRDRQRKAADRERARKVGKIDGDHRADLEVASFDRLVALLEAMADPQAPRALSQLPVQSAQDLREVWLGREVLRAERKKCGARDIARWIIANGHRSDSATFEALCTRVSKDLQRIARFERTIWNGAPLLKRFSAQDEYWSQVWAEVGAPPSIHSLNLANSAPL